MAERLFIAVETSAEARQRLGALQKAVPCAGVQIKWVRPENIHLTLAFLGDTEAAMAEQVKALMDEAAAAASPFAFDVIGAGYFGSRREPRVVWAGLTGDLTPLKKMQTRLSNGLKALGIPLDERDFKPHLTIGRIKGVIHAGAFVTEIEKRGGEVFGRVQSDHIVLMRSVLAPEGPTYTPVHVSPLGTGGHDDKT